MKSVMLPSGVELRTIPESPNADYRAGSDGMIYSRTKYAGFGRKERVDWYPLSGHLTTNGYRSISMRHNNVKVTRNVHRLVCSAFHGKAPRKSHQVRYLDGDRQNNIPANLMWGTQKENWQDRRDHGHGALGENHHSAKLSDVDRAHLKWALAKGLCSQRTAARILGLSQSSVHSIAHFR